MELALLLPVVLLLLLAVLQVGLAGSRRGARHPRLPGGGARPRPPTRDPSVARAAALASSGLDPASVEVTVTVTGDAAATGRRVRVEVAYRAPTVGAAGRERSLADRTIRTTATMRVEAPP